MKNKILKAGQYPIEDRKQIAEAILEIYKEEFDKLENCNISIKATCVVYIDIYHHTKKQYKQIVKITKLFAEKIDTRFMNSTIDNYKYNTYIVINRYFIPKVDIPYKALI